MNDLRVDDLRTALERSRGGVATLWKYSASLSELSVRVTLPGTSENLHIVCNGCTRIEAATTWSNANLQLLESVAEEATLVDERAKFSVTCGQVRVFCNVPPLFATPSAPETK